MMSDDYYIREVDEYSEETHSDDLFQNSGHKRRDPSIKKKQTDVASLLPSAVDEKTFMYSRMDDNGRSL